MTSIFDDADLSDCLTDASSSSSSSSSLSESGSSSSPSLSSPLRSSSGLRIGVSGYSPSSETESEGEFGEGGVAPTSPYISAWASSGHPSGHRYSLPPGNPLNNDSDNDNGTDDHKVLCRTRIRRSSSGVPKNARNEFWPLAEKARVSHSVCGLCSSVVSEPAASTDSSRNSAAQKTPKDAISISFETEGKTSPDSKGKGSVIYGCYLCSWANHAVCISSRHRRSVASFWDSKRFLLSEAIRTDSPMELGLPQHCMDGLANNSFNPYICVHCLRNGARPIDCRLCRSPDCSHVGSVSSVGSPKATGMDKRLNSPLMWRCFRCAYPAHVPCMVTRLHDKFSDLGATYDSDSFYVDFKCPMCLYYKDDIETILTWRDEEPMTPIDSSRKEQLNTSRRNYFIKWRFYSYLHCSWLSHEYIKELSAVNHRMSSTFTCFHKRAEKENAEIKLFGLLKPLWPRSLEQVVPPAWTTVEKFIDVQFSTEADQNIDVSFRPVIHADWVLIKWRTLHHELATWEYFDQSSTEHTSAFIDWQAVQSICSEDVPMASSANLPFVPYTRQPPFVADGTLNPYQLDGVNWLCSNWSKKRNVILADESGLGKTVQIITFLNCIHHLNNAAPHIILVPTSTAESWLQNFAKWAPSLHVLFYGGSRVSRSVIQEYELFNSDKSSLKTNVILVPHSVLRQDISVFRKINFNSLIIDEFRQVKNESPNLFVALREIKVQFKCLMTGTPLQHSLKDLFNLMNFLDPAAFSNMAKWEAQYSKLTAASTNDLLEKVMPYILRRTKTEVARGLLPSKSETIVPVSMSLYQKQIYRQILTSNFVVLKKGEDSKGEAAVVALKTVLTELRKLVDHPYLVKGIDFPVFSTTAEAQKGLIESSAKLKLLTKMLAALKERGHRVLLFSGFSGMLDLIQSVLYHQNYKFERMDENDPRPQSCQDAIDNFNKPNSDVFIFLLPTRTGATGISLTSADTVIVFDSDLNPQADVQSISLAHRLGQQNHVAVYRFVTEFSVEDKIMQIIQKKHPVLDNLILDILDQTALRKDDVAAILKHGARTIFSNDRDSLVPHSEKMVPKTAAEAMLLTSKKSELLQYDDSEIAALLQRPVSYDDDDSSAILDSSPTVFLFASVSCRNDPSSAAESDSEPEPAVGFWESLLRERFTRDKDLETIPMNAATDHLSGRRAAKRAREKMIVVSKSPHKRQRRALDYEIDALYDFDTNDDGVDMDDDRTASEGEHLTADTCQSTQDPSLRPLFQQQLPLAGINQKAPIQNLHILQGLTLSPEKPRRKRAPPIVTPFTIDALISSSIESESQIKKRGRPRKPKRDDASHKDTLLIQDSGSKLYVAPQRQSSLCGAPDPMPMRPIGPVRGLPKPSYSPSGFPNPYTSRIHYHPMEIRPILSAENLQMEALHLKAAQQVRADQLRKQQDRVYEQQNYLQARDREIQNLDSQDRSLNACRLSKEHSVILAKQQLKQIARKRIINPTGTIREKSSTPACKPDHGCFICDRGSLHPPEKCEGTKNLIFSKRRYIEICLEAMQVPSADAMLKRSVLYYALKSLGVQMPEMEFVNYLKYAKNQETQAGILLDKASTIAYFIDSPITSLTSRASSVPRNRSSTTSPSLPTGFPTSAEGPESYSMQQRSIQIKEMLKQLQSTSSSPVRIDDTPYS